MWARIVEFLVACWLAISSFLLSEEPFIKTNNTLCACLVAFFAILSFYKPCQKAHLLTIGVGLWLLGVSYMTFPLIASFPVEHTAFIAILLLMLTVVPSHTTQLSPSWQKYYHTKKHNLK